MIKNTNFIYKLSSIRKAAFSFLEMEMNNAGVKDIPPSYGDILYLIHQQGAGYVKDIVTKSKKDKSTVSNIINQLEKKGYVEKAADPEDGRRTIIRLAPQCEQDIDAMSEISIKLRKKLFMNMSEEEQSILFSLLNKVEKNLKL